MNQTNKFIGYLQYGTKQQPNRTDSSNRLGAPVHITGRFDDAAGLAELGLQGRVERHDRPEHVRGVPRRPVRLQLRPRQQHRTRTRYEDLVTNEILGGGRHWLNKRRRNQYTGALSYFKDNFAGGSHNFKFGGEYLDESGNIIWNQGYADSVIHFVAAPPAAVGDTESVRLYNNGTSSQNALATTSFFVTDTWTIDRLTLNVGVRFDRYRVWLPEQSMPVARFNAGRADRSPKSSKVVAVQPHRAALRRHLRPAAATARRCSRPTGAASTSTPASTSPTRSTRTPATSTPTTNWNDLNGDRVFQAGEEGALHAARSAARPNASIDPNLKNSYTDEASFFVERAVMTDLGVRVGYVWKKDNNGWQQINAARPFERLQRAGHDPRSRSGRRRSATADDGANINVLQPRQHDARLEPRGDQNIDGYEGTYKTLEFSANKRYTQPLVDERVATRTPGPRSSATSTSTTASAPRSAATSRSSAASRPTRTSRRSTSSPTGTRRSRGTVDAGWGLRVTPVLKMQSGAPYGRYISATT